MISDIHNVSVSIEDKQLIKKVNLEGNLEDYKVLNGAFQVVLYNENYENVIKIPNLNHSDSFRLMRDSRMNDWPEDRLIPPTKYNDSQMIELYSLLTFHNENGFGPKVGRVFNIEVNGDTFLAFEMERCIHQEWFQFWLRREGRTGTPQDMDDLNTWTYNELNKPNGYIDMYRAENALKDNDENHVIHKKPIDSFSIGYKADCSIFLPDEDGDMTRCYDIDWNTIKAYFNRDFIDSIVPRYSSILDSNDFTKNKLSYDRHEIIEKL